MAENEDISLNSFEKQRLTLENESLIVQRESLRARITELEEIQSSMRPDESSFEFSKKAISTLLAVAITSGIILGLAIGYDTGKHFNPKPRYVEVSREFLDLLGKTAFEEEEQQQGSLNWRVGLYTEKTDSVIIVR